MSQQINLLRAEKSPLAPALGTGIALALVLLLLGGYVQSLASENQRLRESAMSSEQKLSQVKKSIAALQKQREAEGSAEQITAEIDALKPRVDAVNQLMSAVRTGALGNPDGFARYLATLSGVTEDGVWITSVAISRGGSSVNLAGRALRNESVMLYARRVNQAFKPHGVQFDSLELLPEAAQQPVPGARPAPSAVAFKLS